VTRREPVGGSVSVLAGCADPSAFRSHGGTISLISFMHTHPFHLFIPVLSAGAEDMALGLFWPGDNSTICLQLP
jgi:hypothetical protein